MRSLVAAALVAVLTGCSNGPLRTFTPSIDGFSVSQVRSTAKETVLHGFTGGANDGSAPISRLTQVGKVFYGVSGTGGANGEGTVFSISATGMQFKVIYSFKASNGSPSASAGLTSLDGTLYGVTNSGGTTKNGTVFKVTPAGAFKTIYSFQGGSSDGAGPTGGLTAIGKKLYGTTASGGAASGGACTNCGTVFSIFPGGTEKVIYFFGSKAKDGNQPSSTMVALGNTLYGTTSSGGNGGAVGNGTIFSVTVRGKETVLYRFKDKADGSCNGSCSLTVVRKTLYGTAQHGGKSGVGSIFSLTSGGAFKTLYSASKSGNAGGEPVAPLTVVAGVLYGTMSQGPIGANNGTAFSFTTSGTLTVLYRFAGGNDASVPASSLTLAGTTLYGTSQKGGGSKNAGAIYAISGF